MSGGKKGGPKRFPAETVDLKTDKRSRVFHATKKQANVHKARNLALRAELKEKLGDKTFACAAADLREDFVYKKDKRLTNALDRAVGTYLNNLCGSAILRKLDAREVKHIADQLDRAIDHPRTLEFYLGWLCRVIRLGFGALEPPVRTPRDIPGRRPRAPYGSQGPQANDKPIPHGRELTDRLNLSTGIMRILLHVLIRCGLRIGEALALRRCDIEFEDAEGKAWLHVRKSQEPDGTRKDPKTAAGKRKLPLPKVLAIELRLWFATHPADPSDQVITDVPGKRILYYQACELHTIFQLSLGGQMFGFHRYRAGCVTAWLVSGIRLDNIRAWIGHTDLRTTVHTYASSLMFADELWWQLHKDGKFSQSPRERVRLSLVTYGKPKPDEATLVHEARIAA